MADKEKEILEDAEKELKPDAAEAEEVKEASAETEKQTEESSEENKSEDENKKSKKSKSKGDKKLEALEEAKAELEDRVKRQMAEFENFRKRTEKEKATMFERGAKSVIEKLLPVVDNFERGLASVPEEKQSESVYEGMNLIYKQLLKELDDIGVKPIEALGQEFNPEYHNAVMQVESEEFEEGIVAQELQKGYTYRDSVVRHSMVAVAK